MRVTVRTNLPATDVEIFDDALIVPGDYELDEIKNPYASERSRYGGEPWLVIHGTMTGMPKSRWFEIEGVQFSIE